MIVEPSEIKHINIGVSQEVGLTSGCWDLIHFYHLHYLQRCKAQCDVLVVGVDSDDLVKTNKGNFPAIPDYQRVQMMAALRCVDVAFIMRDIDDLKIAGQSTYYLFKNAGTIYGQDIIGGETAQLVIVPDVEVLKSTTEIKESIKRGT